MDWPSALAPKADSQVSESRGNGPLLSTHRRIEEGQLCDFSKKLVQSHGMETSVPWALFWMQLRTQSGRCRGVGGWEGGAPAGVTLPGGSSGRLNREPLATAPGDREPRPSREQGKGLRLGHQESSPSTVCTKGLGCRGPAPADPGYSKERQRRRGSGNNCLTKR